MKQLRGARFFLFSLSTAGYALLLVSLAAGGFAFYAPPLARLKEGLPRFLPADPPGRVPLLCFAALAGALAFLAVAPAAAFQAGRSRAGVGGRRAFLLAGLPLLVLSALLFFLPPSSAPSAVNAVLVFLFSVAAGAGAGLSLAPYLALGYETLSVEGERTAMASLQTAFLFAGALLPAAVLPDFFTALSGSDPAASFQWSFLLIVLLSTAVLGASFFASREKRAAATAEPPGRRGASFLRSAAAALRSAASARPFSQFLRAEAFSSFALGALGLSALPLGRDLMLVDGEFLRLTAIVFLCAGLVGLPFVRPLAGRLGKKKLMSAGLAALAAGLLLLAFTGLAPNTGGLRWNCATAAAQARDGGVWIGTRRGASRFAAGAWSQVTRAEGLIDDRINSITADGGGVWFAAERGASFFDGKAWTHFSKASGLADNRVLAIIRRGPAVWFLTPAGVSLLDNAQWLKLVPERPGRREPVAPLRAFAVSPQGELWVGTEKGAYRWSGSGWTEFTTANGLPDDTITALATDADGAVLFGTYRGVARYAGEAWSYLTRADGLPSEAVRAVKPAPDGRLFVATDGGCFIASGGGRQVLTRADGLASDRVEDILFARDGSIWFATANGVSVFANGLWTRHQYPLPWIWGLALAILLAFPAAVLLSLPRVFAAEAADALRGKGGERRDALCFAALLAVRTAAAIIAGIVALAFFYGGEESVANPLPARIVLLVAALAAGAGVVFYYRYPDGERGKG